MGWGSRLTGSITALLAILSLTGLWIYLAPFSLASQIQLLGHTLVGIAVTLPLGAYLVRHFRVWYRQKFTGIMVLGYCLSALLIACFASGFVVTSQAALESRLSTGWDGVHLVSGLAVSALLFAHPLLALLRRRQAVAKHPELRAALRRFVTTGTLWLLSAGVLVAAMAAAWPAPRGDLPIPEGYSLSEYLEQFDEYRGNPFAPTYARTASGMLIDPEILSHSDSCGSSGCHEQILSEWQPSAHRFAAMNPPFQEVQRAFAADRDVSQTRYCAGCHDPISLFAGAKDIAASGVEAPGAREGASCAVCHSVSQVDQRGNGDYVITPPRKYMGEAAVGAAKWVSDFLIRAYPQQHLADYDRNVLRTPEFCGACHKQFIPEALNRFGLSPGQNQYDEWRQSHWHSDDPQKDLSCQDCHMRLVPNSKDPGRGEKGDARRTSDDGAHRHHGTIATNMFMPAVLKLPNWKEHVRLTEEWIRGETIIPEIADRWPEGPVATVEIVGPQRAMPGDELAVRVVVTNRKAGHNFTTGPLDFVRAWVHLRVEGSDGVTLAEWGAIDPETRAITDEVGIKHVVGYPRDRGTMVLEAQPLDEKGEPLIKHELWKKAGGRGGRVIFPRYSDSQVYRFEVPETVRGPLKLVADYDDDGDEDLYVTNRGANRLYRNHGDGRFDEVARAAGVDDPLWSMGAAWGDIDRDGDLDLYVCNYVAYDDFGLDGRLDIAVANGSTQEYSDDPQRLIAEPLFLFWNDGKRSHDVAAAAGEATARPHWGRGLAVADFDADGDIDIAVAINRGQPLLLRNETEPRGGSLRVRLRGPAAARFGARVEVVAAGERQIRWMGADVSYLGMHAPEFVFGLGDDAAASEVRVRFADGIEKTLRDVPAGSVKVSHSGP